MSEATDEYDGRVIVIYVNGSKEPFHCRCGSNCFRPHESEAERYDCNACGRAYQGEAYPEFRMSNRVIRCIGCNEFRVRGKDCETHGCPENPRARLRSPHVVG